MQRDREYYRSQRDRILANRVRECQLIGVPLDGSVGKMSKTRVLANKVSLNPRKIYKGKLALTLQERRALAI